MQLEPTEPGLSPSPAGCSRIHHTQREHPGLFRATIALRLHNRVRCNFLQQECCSCLTTIPGASGSCTGSTTASQAQQLLQQLQAALGGDCPTQHPLPSCRSDSQVTACESRESHGHPCGGVGRGQAQGLPDNGPAAAQPCPEVEGPGGHGAPAPTCRGQLHALLPFPTAGTEVGAFFPPAQSQPQTTPAPRADGAGHDGLGTKPPAPPARCWDRDVTPTAPAVHHRKPQPASCTPNPPPGSRGCLRGKQ